MIQAIINQFKPAKQLDVVVPGSKSMTNRALIMAAMTKGKSRLSGVLQSDDSKYCLESLVKLGVKINQIDDTTYDLISPGLHGLQALETLYIGSAGTTARFLPGLLATAGNDAEYAIDASAQLRERPLRPLLEKLEECGAEIVFHEQPYCFPLTILGKTLIGGEIEMEGTVSSQFISGMLMCAPYFEKGLTIQMQTPIVQAQYVQITIDMMRAFGVEVEVDAEYTCFRVQPGEYCACDYAIEADVSTAGYFMAMGLLLDTTVQLELNPKTAQPDIQLLHFLEKMGAEVTWLGNVVSIKNRGKIYGNQTFDLNPCSDQALTVGVIAAYADGPIHLSGIGHIRHHESDRLQVLADNLQRLGIQTKRSETGITIYPGPMTLNVSIPTYDDHRVAMAFSLIGLKSGNITIEDAECTKKTFPKYFQYIQTLGAQVSLEEV